MSNSSNIAPVEPIAKTVLSPLGLGGVSIDGGFIASLHDLNRSAIIPHVDTWLERVGWVENFRAAARGTLATERKGRLFTDADVYKAMEAMAYESARRPAPELEGRVEELTALISAAQLPDGYLNTFYGYEGGPERYEDFQFGHEIFCIGSLLHCAVAWMRTGHDGELVAVARRAADHLIDVFGEDGVPAIDGHPGTESALVEFYRVTGEQKYLDLARLLVDRRGHKWLGDTKYGGEDYFQDSVPVRDAEVLVGHAVRALYLAAGAVDVAVETGDAELLAAVKRQYDRTLARRTYLTGGMGTNHHGESYGDDFELPADRAYAETCAGVASIQLAWRLMLATGDLSYGDAIERALYNIIAACPAEDGQTFHYVNTLHRRVLSVPPRADDQRLPRTDGMRAPWFTTSCCPTNIARLIASLDGYIATKDESGIQLHQYSPGSVRFDLPGGNVALQVRTGYPVDGVVEIVVDQTIDAPWTMTLRVPGWAQGATFEVNGDIAPAATGSLRIDRTWKPGDRVVLTLPITPRFTWADARIDAVRECVAVEVGPLVYAVESTDNPGLDLDRLTLDVAEGLTVEPYTAASGGFPLVTAVGGQRVVAEHDWPYGQSAPSGGVVDRSVLRLIPYYRWANRGPSTMRVWIDSLEIPA